MVFVNTPNTAGPNAGAASGWDRKLRTDAASVATNPAPDSVRRRLVRRPGLSVPFAPSGPNWITVRKEFPRNMSTVRLEVVNTDKPVAEIPLQPASQDIWDKKYRLKTKQGEPLDADIDGTYQ